MIVDLDIKKIGCDVKMEVHSPDEDIGVSKYIAAHKVWEPFETAIFCELLDSKSSFIDIGANIGYYSLIAAKHFNDQGQVISLEPDAINYALLKNNVTLNKLNNIQALNLACSDKVGTATIKKSVDNFGDHRLLAEESTLLEENDYIKTTTVDLLIEELNIPPSLIKIDTQGSELSILLGMRNFFDELHEESVVILEYWPHGIRDRGQSTGQLLNFLEQYDLEMLVLFEETGEISHCNLNDLRRWTETILRPESKQYINLVLAKKSNKDIAKLKIKYIQNLIPFQFNHMYKAVSDNGQELSSALIPLGWSFPEENGVWSQDRFAEMRIVTKTLTVEGKKAYLNLKAHPFLIDGQLPVHRFKATINGYQSVEYSLEKMDMTEIRIPLPETVADEEELVISFEFFDADSPKALGQSDDQRLLAILLDSYGVFFEDE